MVERKIDIECDHEVNELFDKIDKIQETLKSKKGISWHTLSYFYNEHGSFWRFDWEYIWNENHDDLKAVLEMAIKAGYELEGKRE